MFDSADWFNYIPMGFLMKIKHISDRDIPCVSIIIDSRENKSQITEPVK